MAYAVFNGVVQQPDGAGVVSVVPGAHIEVRLQVPGLPLAALKSDRDGTGQTNPFDADDEGRFTFYAAGGPYQIRAYTGTSEDPTFEAFLNHEAVGLNAESDSISQGTQRVVTAAGTVVLDADDADLILIKKTVGAATRVVLASSSERTKPQQISDRKYDANTNNITIVPKRPNVVTLSIASPCVLNFPDHNMVANQPFSLETTGALLTNVPAETLLYFKAIVDGNNFTFSLTPGGAAINATGSQSGVHTLGIDTIMGGVSYVIDSNGGGIRLTPLATGDGWA